MVLVSGFTTSTPFSTPAANCAGMEGDTWSLSVAPALKAAGYQVFTAPEGPNSDGSAPGNAPSPCVGPGQQAPPPDVTVNTGGDVDDNGQFLGQFLAFLNQDFGVTDVQLVGHSDGGIWSRSAINQPANYPGVTITSLTTLGTPHEGSFVADLAVGIGGLDCQAGGNGILKYLCDGVQEIESIISSVLGPTALNELTSSFTSTWNAKQSIGSCPVTTVAGTYVQAPFVGFLLPEYYNPSDTVVGQSSALATPSNLIDFAPVTPPNIPNLINGGTFPVVHSPSLSFITPANLLNTPAITTVVQNAVAAGGGTATPCSAGPAAGAPPVAAGGPPPQAADLLLDPLSVTGPRRPDRLPPTAKGDIVAGKRGVRVTCGNQVFLDASSPGLGKAVLAPVPACRHTLSVSGGRAVELRRDRRHPVRLHVDRDKVDLDVGGPAVRKVETQVSTGGAYRTLRLDRAGRGTLPPDDNGTRVRVLLTTHRTGPRETAVVVLAR